jgi:uncharacterized protein YoxC
MAKISTMIIGMIIGTLLASLLAIFLSHASQEYGISYNNDTLETYMQLNELANSTREIKEQTEGIEEQTESQNIIDRLFPQGYSAMKITFKSFGTYEKMSTKAVEDLQLGEAGQYVKTAIIAIALIVLIVGVLVSAIVKRDL